MGSPKDTMELFAERDIRRVFSENNGWTISPKNGVRPAVPVYQVSRYKWEGNDLGYIAVSFDPVLKEETLSALDVVSKDQGSRTKKYLLTPQAADTTFIPPHVRILRMESFAVCDGKLVWLTKKKNAKRNSPEQAIPA